jgi:hypothetical protein
VLGASGTTVHVQPGTYSGGVTTNRSGTSSQPITFVSDTKWGAHLAPRGIGTIWFQVGDYVTTQGFDFAGDVNNNTVQGNIHGLIVHGQFNHVLGDHVRNIDNPTCGAGNHVSVQGIDSDSVGGNYAIAGHNEISGNVVHDIGWPNSTVCNGSPGIYFGTGFGIAYNNIIYHVGCCGVEMWHAATNMIVAHNLIFNVSAAANGTLSVLASNLGAGDVPGGATDDHSSFVNNIWRDSHAFPFMSSGALGSSNFASNNVLFGMQTSGPAS